MFFSPVECYYWVDYVEDPTCLDTALLQNSWIEKDILSTMQEADKKNVLISKLNKNLDPEMHTLSDLSMRPVHAPEDGLYDYGSMKKHIIQMIEHFSTYALGNYNNFKKRIIKDDRLLLHKLYKGNYYL